MKDLSIYSLNSALFISVTRFNARASRVLGCFFTYGVCIRCTKQLAVDVADLFWFEPGIVLMNSFLILSCHVLLPTVFTWVPMTNPIGLEVLRDHLEHISLILEAIPHN